MSIFRKIKCECGKEMVIESFSDGQFRVLRYVINGGIEHEEETAEQPIPVRKSSKLVRTAPKKQKVVEPANGSDLKSDILDMLDQGKKVKEIAAKLGCSENYVYATRAKSGRAGGGKRPVAAAPVAVSDDDPIEAPESPTPSVRLTPDKLAKVKQLLGEGQTMADIATECDVPEETVERIAVSLGL